MSIEINEYKEILHNYITEVLKLEYDTNSVPNRYYYIGKTYELKISFILDGGYLTLTCIKQCVNYDKSFFRHISVPIRIDFYQLKYYREFVLEHVNNYINELDIFVKKMDADIIDKTSNYTDVMKCELELINKL